MQFLSYSHEQTEHIARRIAQEFRYQNPIVLLSGDLGAGKTTFVKGILAAYGIRKGVTSPSFLLHKRYETPRWLVDHLDLYRSPSPEALIAKIDIADLCITPSLKLIEWPEKLPAFLLETLELSGPVWHVSICETANNGRRFCITKDTRFETTKQSQQTAESVETLSAIKHLHIGHKELQIQSITGEQKNISSTPENRQKVFALCMQHKTPVTVTCDTLSFAEQRWLTLLTWFGVFIKTDDNSK